jgi:hypothetical protein
VQDAATLGQLHRRKHGERLRMRAQHVQDERERVLDGQRDLSPEQLLLQRQGRAILIEPVEPGLAERGGSRQPAIERERERVHHPGRGRTGRCDDLRMHAVAEEQLGKARVQGELVAPALGIDAREEKPSDAGGARALDLRSGVRHAPIV